MSIIIKKPGKGGRRLGPSRRWALPGEKLRHSSRQVGGRIRARRSGGARKRTSGAGVSGGRASSLIVEGEEILWRRNRDDVHRRRMIGAGGGSFIPASLWPLLKRRIREEAKAPRGGGGVGGEGQNKKVSKGV